VAAALVALDGCVVRDISIKSSAQVVGESLLAEPSSGFFLNVEKLFGSMAFQRMSFTEKGVYLTMLCQQWREPKRNLPDDPQAVADLIAVTAEQVAEVIASWEVIRRKFVTSDHTPGRIWNIQVEETRKKQRANLKARRLAGQRGGNAKARNVKQGRELLASKTVAVLDVARNEASNAVAKPSDQIRREEIGREEIRLEKPLAVPARVVSDDDLGDRARELLEGYPVWYAQERHGARLPILGGAIQFQEALTLCQTWDDGRLEKLARVVLTTDDGYISGTDRGWKIFVMKASWADDRLRQWEQANQVMA
jgi:uncharacterized protein YdaU (DUF1376 family)